MAGILDKKSRIFDSIVTSEGRRQIAAGDFERRYASVTDGEAFYEFDITSGSTDITKNSYLEATSRNQDRIALETNDTGDLLGFNTDPDYTIFGTNMFKHVPTTEDVTQWLYVSGAGDFASLSERLVTSSIDNFRGLRLIGTRNEERFMGVDFRDPNFTLDKTDLTYIIKNDQPWRSGTDEATVMLDSLEPFYFDKRLSHEPFFQYLPPMVVEPVLDDAGCFSLDDQNSGAYPNGDFFGTYEMLNEMNEYTYYHMLSELDGEENFDAGISIDAIMSKGYPFAADGSIQALLAGSTDDAAELELYDKDEILSLLETYAHDPDVQREHIYFTNTSNENNVMMQMYEVNSHGGELIKLDTIDHGPWDVQDSMTDSRTPKRTFFIGKVLLDDAGIPSFVNIFTMVLD